jgi:hypothetical protein
VTGIAKIFTHNVPNGFILDNSPFEQRLASWLKLANYTYMSDLYIPTAISVVSQDTGHALRIWSDDPKYARIPLLDVLMVIDDTRFL